MTSSRAYVDHNASSPLRQEAREAMLDAMGREGNASSVHGEGRDLRRIVEAARTEVGALVGVDAESVIFTSGATEAAHLALTPDISLNGTPRPADWLFVLETEHPCILAGGRFPADKIRFIPVLPNGLINMETFDAMLAQLDGEVPFVAVQLVNSETGIVQPVVEIAQKVRLKGGYMLCDAVQAVGRMDVNADALGVDFLILSAHKLGGPQGVGALVKSQSGLEFKAAIRGGGQEKNLRAGTENVAAIAGFGAIAPVVGQEVAEFGRIIALKELIENQLEPLCTVNGLSGQVVVFGTEVERVGNTLLFALAGMNAETALIAFDLEGLAVSSGSACSSGKVGGSHVLKAMNISPELADGAIRVSLGWNSTQEDADKFIAAFERIVKRHAQTLKTRISGAA